MQSKKKIWLFVEIMIAFSLSSSLTYALKIDAQNTTKCDLDYCETTVKLDKYLTSPQLTTVKSLNLTSFLPSKTLNLKGIKYKFDGNNITIYGNIVIGSANYWIMKLSSYLDIDPWWNTSFAYCRNITFTETKGINRTFEPVKINLTGLTKQADDDDVRITSSFCGNGGTEIPRDVISSTATSAYVVFLANYTTTDANHKYSVYYSYPSATAPSYSSNLIFTGDANNLYVRVSGQYNFTWHDNEPSDTGIKTLYYNNETSVFTPSHLDDFNTVSTATLTSKLNGSVIIMYNVTSLIRTEIVECYAYNYYCRLQYYVAPSINYYTLYPGVANKAIYWNGGSWAKGAGASYSSIAYAYNTTEMIPITMLNITMLTNTGQIRTDNYGWYAQTPAYDTWLQTPIFYLLFNMPYANANNTFDRLNNPLAAALGNEEAVPLSPTSVILTINGGVGDITHQYTTMPDNITAIVNVTGLPINITANGTQISNGITSTTIQYAFPAGVWNVTGYTAGNNSYGSSNININATITKATPSIIIGFNTTPSGNNSTCTNTPISINCSTTDDVIIDLWNETQSISNPYEFISAISVLKTFICNTTGNDNYTVSSVTRQLGVLDCSSSSPPSSGGNVSILWDIASLEPNYMYCFDNNTLTKMYTEPNITRSINCPAGCDNITQTCNPPEYQQGLIVLGIIAFFVIVFLIAFKRRRR